jgi:hypothetical protein
MRRETIVVRDLTALTGSVSEMGAALLRLKLQHDFSIG